MSRIKLIALVTGFTSLVFFNPANADLTGQPAPQCQLPAMQGNPPISWQELEGKVVYLDFWASWCVPCRQSFPFMSQMQRELKDQGLEVIAVNLDENLQDAEDFLARNPAQFSVVVDVNQQCAQQYAVKAMPSSYLIDRNGIVRKVHLGFRSGEALEFRKAVEQVLME